MNAARSRPFFPLRRKRLFARFFSTFRGRLATLYVAIELAVLLFAGVLLYVVLSNRVYTSVDEQLQKQAQTVATELEMTPFPYWPERLTRFADHYPGSVELVGANGVLLFASDRAMIGRGGGEVTQALRQAVEGAPAFASTRSLLREDNMRVIALPVHRGERVVAALILGRTLEEIHDVFELMYIIGGILGLLSMLISAYAGYLMAGRALKPIHEITETARAVAAGNLSRRLQSFSQDKEIALLIRALNKMFHDLESSFQAQKRFTADASHELRIPLTVMKGEIEVALRRRRSAKDYAQVLRQQLDTIERMQRIVDGLLTLARADAGLLRLAREDVDLGLLVQEVGQRHLALFADKKVALDIAVSGEVHALGDADRLEQVLFNLLNNAYKYAPAGTHVRLSARAVEGQAVIEVTDQGPGIPLEHQAHLFERFYRPDESRVRSSGGAGLGLAICKRIIEAHAGSIEVESTPGQGACFRVRLPLIDVEEGHQQRLRLLLADKT